MWILESRESVCDPRCVLSKEETILGRNTGPNYVTLSHLAVSRKHCSIILDEKYDFRDFNSVPKVILTDSSRFGTWINGTKYRKQSIMVSHEAEVHIGKVSDSTSFLLKKIELVLCFSGVSREERNQLEYAAKKIGAHVLKAWSDSCTHLVTPKYRPTQKVMMALIDSKPILSPQWLLDISNKKILPTSDNKMYRPTPQGPILQAERQSQSQAPIEEIDRKHLFSDQAFLWVQCTDREFQASTTREFVTRAGGQVHHIKGNESLSFWKSLPPFVIIQERDFKQNDQDSLHGKILAKLPPMVKSRIRFQSEQTINSAILNGRELDPSHFVDLADENLSGVQEAAVETAPNRAGHKEVKEQNSQERELGELLSARVSFDTRAVSKEDSNAANRSSASLQPLLEWTEPSERRSGENPTSSAAPDRRGLGRGRKRRRAARRMAVRDYSILDNTIAPVSSASTTSIVTAPADESQFQKRPKISTARPREKRVRADVLTKDLRDSEVLRIPKIGEIKIDFQSQPFKSARKFTAKKAEDEDQNQNEDQSPLDTPLNPMEFNDVLELNILKFKDTERGIPAKGNSSNNGLVNFKKFRGNKMAKLARARALKRHVEFDLAIHDAFLTEDWIQQCSRDSKIMKTVDDLLDSRVTAKKAPSRRNKRSTARSRNIGGKKTTRQRRARRR